MTVSIVENSSQIQQHSRCHDSFHIPPKTCYQQIQKQHRCNSRRQIPELYVRSYQKNLLASSNMFPAALLFFSQKRSMIGIRYNRLHHTYIFIIWKRYFLPCLCLLFFLRENSRCTQKRTELPYGRSPAEIRVKIPVRFPQTEEYEWQTTKNAATNFEKSKCSVFLFFR